MTKLFLLKPDFTDAKLLPEGRVYFCPSCAMVNGMLNYYPQLREQLEVIYVDFQRPRPVLIDLLGDENQSCPVLVLDEPDGELPNLQSAKGKWFINEPELILEYLAWRYQVGFPHP